MAMDREKLLAFFQAHYLSRQEVLFKLPLNISIDSFWPELLNQRMCVIQIDKLHYMTLCCAHYGMTLPRFRDLAMWLTDGKIQTAYTLDGGN